MSGFSGERIDGSQPVATPVEYADALEAGRQVEIPPGVELYGRILRVRPGEPPALAPDDRSLVMLMGPDGLKQLPGRTTAEMLHTIGFTQVYIDRRVEEGWEFKLLVFLGPGEVRPATWDNALTQIADAHPELAEDADHYRPWLQQTAFPEIEEVATAASGATDPASPTWYDFEAVDRNGSTDPRFMTLERYLTSDRTALDFRKLLFNNFYLGALFSGDGYTYAPDGTRGLQEFMVPNRPLEALGDRVVADLASPPR